MRYIDSTERVEEQTLGYWLAREKPDAIARLRFKTGYFTINGLGALSKAIVHLTKSSLPITAVLGTNERATIKKDVDALIKLIGCPRPDAKLGVVCCSGGLFHPKVVHLTRNDGSQFAYVGSSNLTPAGVNGTNIEAGIIIDDVDGDSTELLKTIAASIDVWCTVGKPGVSLVNGPADTQKLVDDGVLGIVSSITKGIGGSGAGTNSGVSKAPLKPLVKFPNILDNHSASGTVGKQTAVAASSKQAATPTSIQDVLIAEIGKGVRWKQANFPIAVMQNYFGVNPTANEYIDLFPVDVNGQQGPRVPTQVVNVQSQNYRIELTSVSGISYPTNGRPIAVFLKTGPKKFRYRVFFPGNSGYQTLSSSLTNLYSGPARQLSRVIVGSNQLSNIWPSCPV